MLCLFTVRFFEFRIVHLRSVIYKKVKYFFPSFTSASTFLFLKRVFRLFFINLYIVVLVQSYNSFFRCTIFWFLRLQQIL